MSNPFGYINGLILNPPKLNLVKGEFDLIIN